MAARRLSRLVSVSFLEARSLLPALERLVESMCQCVEDLDVWAVRLTALQELCARFQVTSSLLEMAQAGLKGLF